jgi:signal transduction histidine kinase
VKLVSESPLTIEEKEIRVGLFQGVRELLFNVVKHAKVKSAQVHLSAANGQVRIVVSDEGIGFDPAQTADINGGSGLFRLRQRLELLGGRFEATSAPGQGSRFTLQWPVTESAESRL